MKKTKEMYAGGFYLLRGQSSANSSFIEDKEEAIRFMYECSKRLTGFANIHDYLLTKDGWVLVISLLDEKTIKRNYEYNWKRSLRVKEECFLQEVWKIISEQIRQIRFTFTLFTNRKNGREGSKVKRSYERFWFENVSEAEEYLDQMKNQLIRMCQKLKTYRSRKRHFRISKEDAKGMVFLCSLNVTSGMVRDLFGKGCIDVIAKGSDVVRRLVNRTKILHQTLFYHDFPAKLE